MTARQRTALVGPVLVMATLVSSIISSFGAPLISIIARDFDASLSSAQWSLTVALLVGTVGSPVLGRLGDGPRRRAAMLVSLAVVTVGGVVAATAGNLGLLILGRGLQGIGLALAPLAMATVREALPSAKAPAMIALLSVSSAAGLGAGYPVSGWIAGAWGLPAAYWFGAVVSGVTLVSVALVVPPSTGAKRAQPHDWIGTGLLAIALTATLVGVSEGSQWGWGTPAIVILLATGALVVAGWIMHQLRADTPLVQLRLLRRPAVLRGDACALVLGVAMYMVLTGMTAFVQTPRSAGFGFSAPTVIAGLVLIPLSVFMLTSSRTLPTLQARLSTRGVLVLGCLVSAAGCGFFALFHDSLWQAFVMSGLLGIGLGTTFAAIPGTITEGVPTDEAGSAIGFYQVLRFTGYALGSALTATILAARGDGNGQPTVGGYTTVLWTAAGICVAASALVWFLHARNVEQMPPERPNGGSGAAIIVGVDGSPASIKALRVAVVLSAALQKRLKVITVREVPSPAEDVYADLVDDEADRARRTQDNAVRQAHGDRPPDQYETAIVEGGTTRVLLEESGKASMIILGSRGYGVVAGLLMGSVSAACAEHAACPVLVVH